MSYLQAPNGLNFKRSIHDSGSRIRRIMAFLWDSPYSTKQEIFQHVWGRKMGRGSHSYVFTYGILAGYIRKIRVGNRVVYDIGPSGFHLYTSTRI